MNSTQPAQSKIYPMNPFRLFLLILVFCAHVALWSCAALAHAPLAVFGKTVHTMGPAGTITDGVVVIENGKITMVGSAAAITLPADIKTIQAEVVTPGLIDAHSTVGLSGLLNTRHDSDHLERSSPVQPELRALDAYNPLDPLVAYVRSFGITTLHTGHAPGELISGQTIIVKTAGNTVEEALVRSPAMVAATLSPMAEKSGKQSPGSRGKMMSMLRQELIKAQEYAKKAQNPDADKRPARDLKMEMLADVLDKKTPLMVTAHRAQDISSALRLRDEFGFRLVLDGACESHLITQELKAAEPPVPIILHPTMIRMYEETQNASFTTAKVLRDAGILTAIGAGYEAYVPKTRIVLFEAAVAAGRGLDFQSALASITIDAARILNIDARTGSLEPGKDADLALYDADPFEYTSHCVGTLINGKVVWEGKR